LEESKIHGERKWIEGWQWDPSKSPERFRWCQQRCLFLPNVKSCGSYHILSRGGMVWSVGKERPIFCLDSLSRFASHAHTSRPQAHKTLLSIHFFMSILAAIHASNQGPESWQFNSLTNEN
jgi:hypothetical protein